MDRLMKRTGAVAAVLLCAASANAAVFRADGTFSSYTTVVGAADPYVIGLPEPYSVLLNTSGDSILNGTITFTGNSGKQFPLTGGTITTGPTTDFTGITLPSTGGGIGGVVNLSFNASIPDTTQASLNSLIGRTGSGALFGFPYSNGAQGFYSGSAFALLAPEPTTLGALTLALPLVQRRRR